MFELIDCFDVLSKALSTLSHTRINETTEVYSDILEYCCIKHL